MIFLIEYDRNQGRIITFESFVDSDREKAEESRLQLELNLNLKDIDNEVVLLEAVTEEAVRRTHRRYFENLTELMTAPA
jgi:DNA primase catalytic subunit